MRGLLVEEDVFRVRYRCLADVSRWEGGEAVRLRVYLDTSVISAYFDERRPERRTDTLVFWQSLDHFDVYISELTEAELRETTDEALRQQMLALVRPFSLLPIDDEMHRLSREYLGRRVFSAATLTDALHVACAVISRQDVLVSWNFRHLVNRRRRALINQVNIALGYPTIEIVAPPEL
jgi:predicted nucleic acid-binding protein